MKVPFLEYRAALAYNHDVFSVERAGLFKAFLSMDSNFPVLVELPRTHRDGNRKAHVSLIPFMLLLRRQAHTAFHLLTADQSYQAWLLLRPGIEAVLIVGKWVDDAQNAKIWQNRTTDPKAYQKVYTGAALRSASLPGSDRIQALLRTINDRFVHANIDYYDRHLDVDVDDPQYVNVLLNYFDDDSLQLANVFAFCLPALAVGHAGGSSGALQSSLRN